MITPKDFVFLSGFKGLSCWFFGMEIKQKLRRSEKQPKKKIMILTRFIHITVRMNVLNRILYDMYIVYRKILTMINSSYT